MTFVRLIKHANSINHQTHPSPHPLPNLAGTATRLGSVFGDFVHHVLHYLTHTADPLNLGPPEVRNVLCERFPECQNMLETPEVLAHITRAWHKIAAYILAQSVYFSTEVDFLGQRQVDVILEHPDATIELVEIKTYFKKTHHVYAKAKKQLGDSRKFILKNYPDTKLKLTILFIRSNPSLPFKFTKRRIRP